MYTLLKFESEEAARNQAEHLKIQPRLTQGHDGRWFLRSKTLQKQVFLKGLARPQTMSMQRVSLANPSAGCITTNRVKAACNKCM